MSNGTTSVVAPGAVPHEVADDGQSSIDAQGTLTVFSVLWALAAVFHLVSNVDGSWNLAHLMLVVAAGAVLWWPGRVLPLAALATVGIWTAWAEAPILSNHWLLVAFVNVAILLAGLVNLARTRRGSTSGFTNLFVPAARASLLGFYLFAGFAKLNTDFFNRSVSCAPLYITEAANSIGLRSMGLTQPGWVQTITIVATAAIELAIPWLLIVRRSRHVGVVVALVFHGVLAINRDHQFIDFSSVLTALFLLFLPATFGLWMSQGVRHHAGRLAARLQIRLIFIRATLAGALLLFAATVELRMVTARHGREVGWWLWQALIVALVVAVITYIRRTSVAPAPERLFPRHILLAAVPALVVLNGLTPYFEVKTGYGWNMYANLHTVDGASNHLIIRRTLPLTRQQADLVRIIRSDDPGLQAYADNQYALTWGQARRYLSRHPLVSLTYERDGRVVKLARAQDDPGIVTPLPLWREKLQLFRSVDLTSPERCVAFWGAAG